MQNEAWTLHSLAAGPFAWGNGGTQAPPARARRSGRAGGKPLHPAAHPVRCLAAAAVL